MHRRMPQLMNVDDSSNADAVCAESLSLDFFSVRFCFADLVRVHHETTDSSPNPSTYITTFNVRFCCRCVPSLFVNVLSWHQRKTNYYRALANSPALGAADCHLYSSLWLGVCVCAKNHMKMVQSSPLATDFTIPRTPSGPSHSPGSNCSM